MRLIIGIFYNYRLVSRLKSSEFCKNVCQHLYFVVVVYVFGFRDLLQMDKQIYVRRLNDCLHEI